MGLDHVDLFAAFILDLVATNSANVLSDLAWVWIMWIFLLLLFLILLPRIVQMSFLILVLMILTTLLFYLLLCGSLMRY